MESEINRIYIEAPATTSIEKIYDCLHGELNTKCFDTDENINIVLVVCKRKRATTEWSKILNSKLPQAREKTTFVITKEDWFSEGLIYVIPTPIFETTPIKLIFERNPILELGFKVEIFARDTVITREVAPSSNLSTGVTVSFAINWTIASNTTLATPVVETAV